MVKVSVIIPLKDDKRIFDLIRSLEKQTYKDFEVLVADDSTEKVFQGRTKLNLRYFHTKPMTIAEKFHFLAKESKAKLIAIMESDCVPTKNWLKELVKGYAGPKTIIEGAQEIITVPSKTYANMLMPKAAFDIPHDLTLKVADDTEWFFALEEAGYKFKHIDKGLIRHYKDPTKKFFRTHKYGKEHAYVYVKHGMEGKLVKSVAFQVLSAFFSLLMAGLLLTYGIIYKIEFLLRKIWKGVF